MIGTLLRFALDGSGDCQLTGLIGMTDHILDPDPNDT